MNKYSIKLLILLIIFIPSIKIYGQDVENEILGKIFHISDMVKLINMDVDETTSYLSEFGYSVSEMSNKNKSIVFNLRNYSTVVVHYSIFSNKIHKVSYTTAIDILRKFINFDIKKLNLKKTSVEINSGVIITYFEGKSYFYEKHEWVNSYGNQQVDLFITQKITN
jgi:hypothetical protein